MDVPGDRRDPHDLGDGNYSLTRPETLKRGASGEVRLEVRLIDLRVGPPPSQASDGFKAATSSLVPLVNDKVPVFDDMTATLSLPSFTVKPDDRLPLAIKNGFGSASWSIAPNSTANEVQLGRVTVTRADGSVVCEFGVDVRIVLAGKGKFAAAIATVTGVKTLVGGLVGLVATAGTVWAFIRRFGTRKGAGGSAQGPF